MLKTTMTSIALIALSSTAVFAADLTEAPPEAPMAEDVMTTPVFTWSGAYAGLQGGYGFGNGDVTAGGVTLGDDFNGGIFGAFVGAQMQNGNFVYGIEGDLNYNWNDEDYVVAGVPANIGTDWSGSVRGRLGYAMDRALIYGTAGWAVTRGFVDTAAGDESETFNGYTVGAGIDYALTDNVFARGEYRFSDYGDETIGGTNVDFNQHSIMVGVGVKF